MILEIRLKIFDQPVSICKETGHIYWSGKAHLSGYCFKFCENSDNCGVITGPEWHVAEIQVKNKKALTKFEILEIEKAVLADIQEDYEKISVVLKFAKANRTLKTKGYE